MTASDPPDDSNRDEFVVVRAEHTEIVATNGLFERVGLELWIQTELPIAEHRRSWTAAVLRELVRQLRTGALASQMLDARPVLSIEVLVTDLQFDGQWPSSCVSPEGTVGLLVGFGASAPVRMPFDHARCCGVLVLNVGQLSAVRSIGHDAAENIASYGWISRVEPHAPPSKPIPGPPDFGRLLAPAVEIETIYGVADLMRRELGSVGLPDGRVFACDPLAPADRSAFMRELPPGEHEAVAFVARMRRATVDPDVVVAAALICKHGIPSRWEPAARRSSAPPPGAPIGTLMMQTASAYDVEHGIGCLMGSDAAQQIFEDDGSAEEPIMAALDRDPLGAVAALRDEAKIAVFRSGGGDGTYVSWWGLDEDGTPMIVLTDFALLAPTTAPPPEEHPRKWWQFWK